MSQISYTTEAGKRKSPSIAKVAQLAGTSVATVSRVFNNSNYVSKKMAEHIREVAEQLNYIPDSRGRSLRSGKHWNIGVIVPIGNYCDFQFHERMVSCLARWITNNDYGVSLEFLERGKGNKLELPVLLSTNKVDGLVLVGHLDQKELEQVAQWGKEVCLIENSFESPRFCSVNLSHKEGSIKAVSYLASLGHKNIAYVMGSLEWPSTRGRFEGYQAGIAKNGLSSSPEYVMQVNEQLQDYRGGYAATQTLLQKSPEITAIMYVNDWYAIGGLAAVQAMGRRVPDDISLLGYDDHWMASEVVPLLTTVSAEMDELCRAGVELLLRSLKNESHTQANAIVWPRLIIRHSCAEVAHYKNVCS